MKKVTLILILLISFSAFSQVSLKGYTLGEKLEGEEWKYTTVAGIEGVVTALTIEDTRIYSITFFAREQKEEEVMVKIFKYELDFLKEGVEKKYGITLEHKDADLTLFDYILFANKDDVEYKIFVDEIDGDEVKYRVAFTINSDELYSIYLEELQNDF